MISGERMDTFLASLDAGNTPFLDQIEREALETNVPVIRTQTQGLLRFLLAMRRPMSILEVGCAIGFSALLMSEYAPEGCKITTIEKYEKRIPVAKANFARAGKEETITLLEGDAADILPTLQEKYDVIFCQSTIAGVAGRWYGKKYHCKVIYIAHGFQFYEGASKIRWAVFYHIEKILNSFKNPNSTLEHRE